MVDIPGELPIGKRTLILDLDETLIHCFQKDIGVADLVIRIPLKSGSSVEAGINIRPYAK